MRNVLVIAYAALTSCTVDGWEYSPLLEKMSLIEMQATASTTSTSAWDILWDHSTQPCSGNWAGVRCNADGYVSHLYLNSKKLGGKLFDKFYFFRDLEQLWLAGNDITNELPASIGSLDDLTYLDISGNHFVGQIPASFGSLQNLQVRYRCY